MNKVMIIGNLTRDPEMRMTADGTECCNFTVAVNRRVRNGAHPEADYFRVTAWRELGQICGQYLAKGKKVCVIGSVRAQAYVDNNGKARATLEVSAQDVEFLTPKGVATMEPVDGNEEFEEIEDEELPF